MRDTNPMTADEARQLLTTFQRGRERGDAADVWGPLDRLEDALRTVVAREGEVAELRAMTDRLQRACAEGLPREVIYCPACDAQHIDGDNGAEFATRPHHTHLCQFCGHVWDNKVWSFGAHRADPATSLELANEAWREARLMLGEVTQERDDLSAQITAARAALREAMPDPVGAFSADGASLASLVELLAARLRAAVIDALNAELRAELDALRGAR